MAAMPDAGDTCRKDDCSRPPLQTLSVNFNRNKSSITPGMDFRPQAKKGATEIPDAAA